MSTQIMTADFIRTLLLNTDNKFEIRETTEYRDYTQGYSGDNDYTIKTKHTWRPCTRARAFEIAEENDYFTVTTVRLARQQVEFSKQREEILHWLEQRINEAGGDEYELLETNFNKMLQDVQNFAKNTFATLNKD